MTKRNQFVNADGETIEAEICPDKFGIRIPAMLMDAAPRTHIVDAFGAVAGRKQGYCFADQANDPRVIAYLDSAQRAREAWRTKVRDVGPATIQSHITQLHGVANEMQGRLDEEAANEGTERARRWRHEPAADAREYAYLAHETWLRDAWRTVR